MGIGARRIDESLVAAAIAGDDAALGQVIDAWLPAVYAWCGRLGAGRIDPEEAAHDVMMLLVRKHHTVIPAQLGAWLFGACRRVVANHRRRLWWRRWVPGLSLDSWPGVSATDAALDEHDRSQTIAKALDEMSAEHREVLVLCYLEDRSVAEAAALLGIPPGTVKSRLFHARAHFQRSFPEQG